MLPELFKSKPYKQEEDQEGEEEQDKKTEQVQFYCESLIVNDSQDWVN